MSRRNFIRNSGTILATGLVLPGALSATGNSSKNQQSFQAVYVGNTSHHPLFSGGEILHLSAAAVSSIILEKTYLTSLISGKSARRFVITDRSGNCYHTHKLVVDEPGTELDVAHNYVQVKLAATTLGFENNPQGGKVQQQVRCWVMNPERLDSTIAAAFLAQPQTAVMCIA